MNKEIWKTVDAWLSGRQPKKYSCDSFFCSFASENKKSVIDHERKKHGW